MDKAEIVKLIQQKAAKYGVPSGLLTAIVQRESAFDVNARGADNEVGLAQLLRGGAIAEWEQYKAPLGDYAKPDNNLEVAAWYLGKRIPAMLRHYGKPVTIENRVIAYNAGIGRVLSGEVPGLTKDYVAFVKGYMESHHAGAADLIKMLAALLGVSVLIS